LKSYLVAAFDARMFKGANDAALFIKLAGLYGRIF
jgi:hypothetical protein